MISKKILLFLLAGALFCACKTKNTQIVESEEPFVLPENAIPITYYPSHIYIEGKIDSIAGHFIFDTGADGLYLDSTYYANNPFPDYKFGRGMLSGAGTTGRQSVTIFRDTIPFKFGQYEYQSRYTIVLRLKSILGDLADGMIGQSFFSDIKCLMEINYFHQYLMLHKDKSTIDLSDYTKISLEKHRNRFFIPAIIQINDTLTIKENFTLDIGSGGTISLRTAIAEKYNLSTQITDKVSSYNKYGGVGGLSSNNVFRANFIEIGGYKLDNILMDYSEDTSGALANDFYAGGLLGNKLLEYFDIIIDFSDSTAIYLKPNPDYNKPFELAKLGFKYKNRVQTMNGWVVVGLYKDSPAEKAGLQVDDKIISVNGINVGDISYKGETDFWGKFDNIELVVLRNGKEIMFKFELLNI